MEEGVIILWRGQTCYYSSVDGDQRRHHLRRVAACFHHTVFQDCVGHTHTVTVKDTLYNKWGHNKKVTYTKGGCESDCGRV